VEAKAGGGGEGRRRKREREREEGGQLTPAHTRAQSPVLAIAYSTCIHTHIHIHTHARTHTRGQASAYHLTQILKSSFLLRFLYCNYRDFFLRFFFENVSFENVWTSGAKSQPSNLAHQ
jgi:hypothetical protein